MYSRVCDVNVKPSESEEIKIYSFKAAHTVSVKRNTLHDIFAAN